MTPRPHGWTVKENRAIRRHPDFCGISKNYAVPLGGVVMVTALMFNYWIAAAWLVLWGGAIGRAVAAYDVFAWEIAAKNLTLPRRMLP